MVRVTFLNFTSIDIFLQKSEKHIKITHLSKGKDSTYLFSQSPIIKMKSSKKRITNRCSVGKK